MERGTARTRTPGGRDFLPKRKTPPRRGLLGKADGAAYALLIRKTMATAPSASASSAIIGKDSVGTGVEGPGIGVGVGVPPIGENVPMRLHDPISWVPPPAPVPDVNPTNALVVPRIAGRSTVVETFAAAGRADVVDTLASRRFVTPL